MGRLPSTGRCSPPPPFPGRRTECLTQLGPLQRRSQPPPARRTKGRTHPLTVRALDVQDLPRSLLGAPGRSRLDSMTGREVHDC
jgi:hypothetical protein